MPSRLAVLRLMTRLMLHRRLHRQVGRLFAFENAIDVTRRLPEQAEQVGPIRDQATHQVELDQGRMHVRRAKNGTPSVHPIRGDEVRALRTVCYFCGKEPAFAGLGFSGA
jgi:hypothetical protein